MAVTSKTAFEPNPADPGQFSLSNGYLHIPRLMQINKKISESAILKIAPII